MSTMTHLFYCFSLKACDFPTGGVIEGQFGIWVAARIKQEQEISR